MTLSLHFHLAEFLDSPTARAHGIVNEPDAGALANIVRTAALLEEVRALLGVPLRITSGYRCPALNAAVGGARTSAHLDGRAADLRPVGMDLQDAFALITHSGVAYDQCIIERTASGAAWIHLGIAREGETPRQMALSAEGASAGAMTYTRVAEG